MTAPLFVLLLAACGGDAPGVETGSDVSDTGRGTEGETGETARDSAEDSGETADTAVPCTDMEADGDGYVWDGCVGGTDCDDADAAVHPDALEVCSDDVDNDCDGGSNGCYDRADVTYRGAGWLGYAMEMADIDGDGNDELLASENLGTTAFGRVYLVGGEAPGEYLLDESWHTWWNGDAYVTGYSLVAANLFGSETPLLAVGSIASGGGAGAVFVVDPAAAPAPLYEEEDRFVGSSLHLGQALFSHDHDGDGDDDLWMTEDSPVAPARLMVASEAPSGNVAADDLTVIELEYPRELAHANATRADFDGDGVADLGLGAPAARDSSGNYLGRFYLILGTNHGLTTLDDVDASYDGPRLQSGFGSGVSAADMDADGTPELVVGAVSEGRVFVLPPPGALGESPEDLAIARITGDPISRGVSYSSQLGWDTCLLDANADAMLDLATTAPVAGSLFVFAGPLSGEVSQTDAMREVHVEEWTDRISCGDLDGGGRADMAFNVGNYIHLIRADSE